MHESDIHMIDASNEIGDNSCSILNSYTKNNENAYVLLSKRVYSVARCNLNTFNLYRNKFLDILHTQVSVKNGLSKLGPYDVEDILAVAWAIGKERGERVRVRSCIKDDIKYAQANGLLEDNPLTELERVK